MKLLKIHTSLLNHAKVNNEVTLLAKWISFKYVNRNSLFFNYNPHKASKRYYQVYGIKIDAKTVKSNVNSFISRGWCTITTKGHLKFNRQKQITENLESKGYINLSFFDKEFMDYKSIRLKINEELFRRKIEQQNLLLSAEHDLSKRKKAEKVFSNKQLNKHKDIMDDVFNISYKGLAEIFGVKTPKQAFEIVKELTKRTNIQKIRRQVCLSKGDIIDSIHGFDYYFKGMKFRSFTNEYYYA